ATNLVGELALGDAGPGEIGDNVFHALVEPHAGLALREGPSAQLLGLVGEPPRQDAVDGAAHPPGADVGVVLVDVAGAGEVLRGGARVLAVRDDDRGGVAAVGLDVPGVRLDLRLAGLLADAELLHPVLDIAPDPGELLGEVDGRAADRLAAALVAVERALREAELGAGLLHLGAGRDNAARDGLG